jgi:glycosyltransferase involved in cell wall biosynthesis
LKLCNEFAEIDPRIKVYTQRNQGQGVARNLGLTFALGKYICYVDPDDWIDKELTEILVPLMNGRADVDFINFGINFIDDSGRASKNISQFEYYELNGKLIFHDAMLDRNIFSSPCNKIYRTHFLRENEIYFPNTRAYEDILYSRLVAFYSKKCLFINKVFYHALMRSGSTTRKMGFEKIHDALEVLKIGEEKFIPGFEDNLIGMKANEEKEFKLKFPEKTSPME